MTRAPLFQQPPKARKVEAAKEKQGIGVLKNKQQLVKALEMAAGEELAEQAKQEALKAGEMNT